MNSSPRVSALAYGVALASLAVAVLVRWLLDPVLEDTLPLTTLFAAIGVAVWVGGYRPALLVAALGYIASNYLFMQPRGLLELSEPRNLVGLFVFLATASTIIGFGEALRRARQHYRMGEAAAHEQAELLRITLASIGDGVIATDPDSRITTMNAVAEALTGWTNDEAAGLPVTQVFRIVNEDTRLEVENPALRTLKEGVIEGLANHTLLIAKDGTERSIDNSAAPIRRSDGEVVGCVLVFRDVSERYQAEAEQREARQQIATTLESVTDGFIRYDRDWRIVYVNAEAERINKLTRSEMLGKTPWELFPAVVGTTLETEFRRAVAERVTVEFENHYAPFGRWYSLKGYPTADGGLTTFIRDITEQKQFEERLMESEDRYRAIGESIDYGVWVCDSTGRNTYASESFLRLVGMTQQQCSDFGWGDVLHPDDAEATIAAWKECVRTQGRWDRVHRFKGVDGRWHHVLARGVPLRHATGQILGWAGLNLDISRMMEAEQEIVRIAAESERQRRLYETVLGNTPDFVYVFSLDHRVLYANDALIKMWGRGHDGAIGKTFLEVGYEPWHADMHAREIDQVRATRQPIRGEVPFTGTHGRRQYDYIFVPVIGADGEVEAVAGTTRDVTERRQTEDQLRRNHDTFFALIQNNPFGVYAVDADFRLRQVSLGAQRAFETVRPLLGRDFAEVLRTLWPEPFAKEAIARFRHTLDTGEPYSAPSTIERRADIGAVEAYDWRIERISMPDGRYGVVCYFYDLSERQRWDAILRDSEERLRTALTAARMVAWEWTPADGKLRVSESAADVFGLPAGVGLTAIDQGLALLHPDDVAVYRDAFQKAIDERGSYQLRYRLIRPDDGRTIRIEERGHAVFDQPGGGVRLYGVATDVTDRHAAEEEVARLHADADRERRLFDTALSNTSDLNFIFAPDGRFVYANRSLLALWGLTAGEAIGRSMADLGYPPDVQARVLGNIRRVTETGQAVRDETPYTSPTGESGFYEYALAPAFDAEGAVLQVVGSARDISARKRIEEELRRLARELQEAHRRKDEFLATMAHELRNPLAPIRNGLEVLRLAGANGAIEEVRAMMERQLTQLVRLVDDLLDMSRVTSGKLELRRERVELRAVIDAAVETSRPAIEQAGHELAVVIPDEPILVDGDPTRLAQVVSNLLNNSAKYTHRGGHVRLAVRREDGMASVVVADDGIGIPPNMLGKVFEMFTQVDRALEKTTGGLGIGLSLVKGLVEMHGGTIEARSEGEGQGSEFIVRMPVAFSAVQKVESPGCGEPVGTSSRRRILVADDNVDSAESLGRLLELLGNDVSTANDGLQAVDVAEAFRPDVILLDIGMPKLNGYEACRRIREQSCGKNVILVAMTGWGQDEDKRRSQEVGFNHHLVKPVEFEALEKLLSSLKAETA